MAMPLPQWSEKIFAIDEMRMLTRDTAAGACTREFCARLRQRLGLHIAVVGSAIEHGRGRVSFPHRARRLSGRLGPAIELGRCFVTAHPEYTVLYGPVSISNTYSPLARASLVAGLRKFAWRQDLAACVSPRLPFVSFQKPVIAYDPEELGSLVTDIDGAGIPVLLKQYLKMAGKLAAFNLDPAFSNTIDGLIVVDLRQTPRKLLERYLGAESYARLTL
ncbi:MAG: hypothetical protein HYX27_23665 [Acidobacteria bacterium]|nr:hypothetical protein [Acidobacteriota bacterium]